MEIKVVIKNPEDLIELKTVLLGLSKVRESIWSSPVSDFTVEVEGEFKV